MNQVLHKYGTSEIGVKVLGQVNTDGWWDACKEKFRNNEEKFGAWQSRIDVMLRKHSFNPIKVVPDGKGGHKVRFYPFYIILPSSLTPLCMGLVCEVISQIKMLRFV